MRLCTELAKFKLPVTLIIVIIVSMASMFVQLRQPSSRLNLNLGRPFTSWVASVPPEGQGSEEARAHRRFMAEHPVPITFVVLQIPDSPTCGGCVALATLADALQALGEAVARPRLDRFDTASSPVAPGKIKVAVFPEAYDARALRKRLPGALAVRWMLAPVPEPGTRNWPNGFGAEKIDPGFAQDEWVWNYGIYGTPGMTGGVHGVPHSNLLIAQTNPTPGDDLDLTGYPALPRHGTVFTYRKGKAWHGADLQLLHKPGDTEMMRCDSRADVIMMLRSHEYFVCYDPFSYLAFMAAQLGCIPVIHPMRGHSKFEWLNATLFSGYMRDNKLTNLQGVAYGWGDVEFARKTLGRARAEQYRVKAWGLGTVARFARDARRWAAGQRSGFEGAKNTSDFYPTGWITRHLENKRKNNNGTTRALAGTKTSSGAPSPATSVPTTSSAPGAARAPVSNAIIVTGMEHSGTTVTSMLIMSAPGTMGPVETGFLLAARPAEFDSVRPWSSWAKKSVQSGWLGFNDTQLKGLMAQQTHLAMYDYALRESLLLRNAKTYVDKTPGYCYQLKEVMRRAPGVPVVVVTKRNPRGQTEERTRAFQDSLTAAQQEHGTALIHVVRYEDLFQDPCKQVIAGRALFGFLGLSFDASWFDGKEIARKRGPNSDLDRQLHGGFGAQSLPPCTAGSNRTGVAGGLCGGSGIVAEGGKHCICRGPSACLGTRCTKAHVPGELASTAISGYSPEHCPNCHCARKETENVRSAPH